MNNEIDRINLRILFKHLKVDSAKLKFNNDTYIYIHLDENEYQLFRDGDMPTNYEDVILKYESEDYALISWPESQQYMNEDWFKDECFLCNEEERVGPAAYFIPSTRIIENY